MADKLFTEKQFDAQVNYGWGLSLNMTGKAPAVAKRIFDKYADAFGYASDLNDSAIEGLILTVVNDGDKNGAYFVQQVGAAEILADEEKGIEAVPAKEAILVKLSSTNAAEVIGKYIVKDAEGEDTEVQETVQASIQAIKNELATLNGGVGSIGDQIAGAIGNLDAEIAGEGAAVSVTVTQTDGVISKIEVAENFDFGYFDVE